MENQKNLPEGSIAHKKVKRPKKFQTKTLPEGWIMAGMILETHNLTRDLPEGRKRWKRK